MPTNALQISNYSVRRYPKLGKCKLKEACYFSHEYIIKIPSIYLEHDQIPTKLK